MAEEKVVKMSTTTSTQESGLLDVLVAGPGKRHRHLGQGDRQGYGSRYP